MRKKFLLMLTLLILALGGSGNLFAQTQLQLLVNYDYNSSTEGWGTTKFSNYDGAYAYATANGKTTATIVIEKTNTISGNCFNNNHKNYSKLAVVIKDGATMGNSLSKWDMTYPVTVEPGGTLTCARGKSNSISNIHIKNKLIVGAKGATKKAYVNFLSDEYQDCDISIRYNGSIEVYYADFYIQDLDAQGKLTIEDSKVEVDGAFASATSLFYPTTLTNSTITINGNQISGGLGDFAGGTSNQLGNVKINNSTLTIKEGDTKVAANVTATNSNIAVNNLTVNSGKTLNLNDGSTLDAENIDGTGSVKIDGVAAPIIEGAMYVPVSAFAALKAAVEAGNNVQLTADITTTSAIVTSGVTSVIDLNGKTLTIGAGDNKFNDKSNVTIKNGNVNITNVTVTGNAIFCLDEYEKTLVSTLTFDNVNLTGDGYSSAYGIFYIGESSVLNVNGGEWNLKNDKFEAGGVFKADASGAELNIDGLELTAHNVRRVVTHANTTIENSTMTISGDAEGVDAEMEHGFNRSPLAISNSTITMKDMVGRGITAQNGAVTISENSNVNITNCIEATIDVRNNQTVTIDNTSTVFVDKEPTLANGCTINGTVKLPTVAKIGAEEYSYLADALNAAKSMTGDVTVEICAKVTMNQPLAGSYTSIKFVGPQTRNNTEAEIYLDVQGYITATGKKVAFENLKLSKSEGGFIANAGFMNVAFGIFDVAEVSYTNCTFLNGAYASSGKVTYTGCTFKKSWDKYGLWAYGNVDVTVNGCTFADYRGIKMYAENGANASVEKPNLIVNNTNFSAVDNKPAIVLTYGESVTLGGNTYSSTGVFELDLDGQPNGVAVTSDVAPKCINDNGACGVLVDGKIYTTVAQAAEVATNGSTVTLLHDSEETVELPFGVIFEKNGFTADNVTITQPFADYVELPSTMNENNYKAMFGTNTVTDGTNYYATLQAAVEAVAGNADAIIYCKPDAELGAMQHAPVVSTLTVYGNNASVTGFEHFDLGNTDKNEGGSLAITDNMTLTIKNLNGYSVWGAKSTSHIVNLVLEDCFDMGKVFITGTTGTLNIAIEGSEFKGLEKEAIYSNADGAISLNNVAFSNLNKAVNLNHKAAGTQTVTINGCSFTDCGADVAADQIPVRVLSSVDGGKSVLNVSNTTFSGTPTGGADILLPNDKGVTDATIQTTAANIKEGTAEMKNITEDVVYKYNNAVAKIGETPYASLQAAIDKVNDGETVVLVSDCAEVVSFTQTADKSFVIDGNNKIYTGSINITARAGKDAPSTLVIKNFNFNTDAITHDFIKSVETNYYPNNITISGCKFNGTTDINTTEYAVVAVRLKSANNIKIENCTGSGLHSFLQNTAGWNIQIDNVDVTNSLSGFAMGTVQGANIKNCDLVVNKSGIRFDAQLNNNAVITDNEIEAFIPVVVRKASVESAMTFNGENTFTATNTDGLWCAIGTSEYATNGQMPTAATGNVSVTLNDAGLNADGIYGNSINFEGLGTEESPYLINNLNDLKFFRNNVDKQAQDGSTQYAGKYFKLTADIDLAGINWNPIGSMSGDHGSFKGVFDGGNHTISNLNVEQAGDGIGLFARTTGNAVIKNLKLNNVTVKSTNNSNYVGGVVGNAFASTKIENVHVTGDVQISGRGYIGGIVGHGYVVMDDVSVVANEDSFITSTFWCAGGILGYAGEGTTNIMNAHVEGLTIKSAAGGLGSIVGMAEDNNGTQPISGSNLSAKKVEIKTYVGGYGTAYENYCIGYLYGGSKTSKLTGELKVENVVLENASGNFPSEVSDAVANINGKIYFNLADAIATIGNGDVTINLLRDVTLDYNARDEYGIEGTTSVTINGKNHTLTLNQKNSDWASIGLVNGKLVLNNMTIEKTGYGDTSGAWNTHAIIFSCPLEMTNVTVNNGIAVQAGATLDNVTINEANGYYGLWINGNGQEVTMNGGSITATNGGRGIKIADEYISNPAQVTLKVTETVFKTAKKAAVLVSSTAGAKIAASNVNIDDVAADNVNFVWVDEDWAANYGNVEVTGATVAQESIDSFVAAISKTQDENTNIIIAYYKTLPEAIAAVQAGETIELINDIKVEDKKVILIEKSLTINGNDKKVTSNANRVFRVTVKDTEVTLNEVNMVNTAVRVEQNDIRGISVDDVTGVKLTLNNCSVDFTDESACDWSYAVNVVGGSGHDINVNGGTYEGANVINVRGAGQTVLVKDATLTSLYLNSDQYYGACIWVSQNQNSSVEATGNIFNGSNAVAFNVGYTPVTESNNTDNTGVVAITNGKPYATLEAAFKAATSTSVCTIDIIKDVTVDYYWDARNTGSKFTVPVTIDGNGKTIKFTNTVYDGGNYMSAFRFEADATVKNLTVDMTDAISGFAGRFRAISAEANLTVDGCTFIGNGSANNTRAIIFGEGAGANAANLAISITNSNFEGWKRGISDNENAQDVKTVTITGNTLKDAAVYVSAHNNVTFTDNTVEGAYVNIKSYTDNNKLTVTATGNTLTANVSGDNVNVNKIDAGGVVVAQDEFIVVPKGDNFIGYISENGIWGEVWGNAKESFVINVLDANNNVMGTTSLNNIGGIIDGDVNVTWNLLFDAAANTDSYWTMNWTTAPNINNMPAKVELLVDGVKVSGGNIQLNSPDNLNPIVAAVTYENGDIKSYATSLANAFAYADNNTVVVLRDITLTETATIAAGKVVTLDLNDNTITGRPTVAAAYAVITNKGDLTIENGTIICDHALTGSTAYAVNTIVNSGALTIYDATIENKSTASNQIGYAIDNNSTSANAILVVESGRVIVSGYSVYYDGIRQFCNSETNANNVTIKGGEVSSLWMQNPSDNSTGRNTKDVKGSFTIEGGTLNALYIEPSRSFSGLISAGHVASISRFDSTDEQNEERLLAGFITGGTFTMDVNEYCHEYYDAVEGANGIWTIEQVLFAQTTSLNRGWNWYSSYINLSSDKGLKELQDALDGKGIEIKGKTGFTDYHNNSWSMTEDFIISAKQMYMIKTTEAVEIMVDGVKMNPAATPITLRTGWNWIGYPVDGNLPINVALAGHSAVHGDVIKDRNYKAEYSSEINQETGKPLGWIGTLKTMIPGQGYMYKSNKGTSTYFTYSDNVEGAKYANENITSDNNYWAPEMSQYANNMTITAMLNIDGNMVKDNYEIAAFANGECRGSARPIYIEGLDAYMLFMTVFGEDVEELTFKCYDINNETEYELNNRVNYSDDANLGSIDEPYMFFMNTLGVEESTLDMINIYPNPTTRDRAISLQATCDNVEVFNALGVKVAEYQNVDTIDALETAGVYVIRVTINGEVKNCRLVVE